MGKLKKGDTVTTKAAPRRTGVIERALVDQGKNVWSVVFPGNSQPERFTSQQLLRPVAPPPCTTPPTNILLLSTETKKSSKGDGSQLDNDNSTDSVNSGSDDDSCDEDDVCDEDVGIDSNMLSSQIRLATPWSGRSFDRR